MSQYEIISDTLTGLDELIADGKVNCIESEQRAYFDMSLDNAGLTYIDVSTGCLAYPIILSKWCTKRYKWFGKKCWMV